MADDAVDQIIEQWAAQRPDLDLEPMALVGRLGRVALLLQAGVASELERQGLSIAEFDVLAALRRSGEPFQLTPGELAGTLMLSPSAMTNRIDRLEEAGLVERSSSPTDRRSLVVTLTGEGHRRVDEAVGHHVANEDQLLDGLGPTERHQLDSLLRQLLTALEP